MAKKEDKVLVCSGSRRFVVCHKSRMQLMLLFHSAILSARPAVLNVSWFSLL